MTDRTGYVEEEFFNDNFFDAEETENQRDFSPFRALLDLISIGTNQTGLDSRGVPLPWRTPHGGMMPKHDMSGDPIVRRPEDRLAELNKLYPGVDSLVAHSKANVLNEDTVLRESGLVSTISSMTVGIDDREFLIPTIYFGRQVSEEEAIDRAKTAMRLGVVFPSAPAGRHEELDALSKEISLNLYESKSGLEKAIELVDKY